MRTLVIAEGRYSKKVLQIIQGVTSEGHEPVVLALDEAVRTKVGGMGIPYRLLSDYPRSSSVKYPEHRDALDLIKSWGELKIAGNLKLRDLAEHRNISLWDLHQVELLLYFIAGLIRQVQIAKDILEAEKPCRMIIAADFHSMVEPGGIRFDPFLLKALHEIGKAESLDVKSLGRSDRRFFPFLIFAKPYAALGKDAVEKVGLILRGMRKNRTKRSHLPKVIFINHTTRNADTIIPVIKEMKSHNSECLVIQLGPDGEDPFKAENIPYRRVEEYLTAATAFRIIASSFRAAKGWRFLNASLARHEGARRHFLYEKVDLWEAANDVFKAFWSVIIRSVRNTELANAAIEAEKPAILIGTNERSGSYRAFYELARKRNIPYLSIQYGLINDHPLWRIPVAADLMAVEGTKVMDIIAQVDGNTDKLIVTGQPKYDAFIRRSRKISRDEVFIKYGLDPRKKLVVYASHTFGEEQSPDSRYSSADDRSKYFDEIVSVYEAFSRMNHSQLVVKPHPFNERVDLHQKALKKISTSNIRIVSQRADIGELIASCDVLITRHSTAGLDALILGKKLVVVNLTGYEDPIPYVEYGAAWGAYRRQEVYEAINGACYDETTSHKTAGRERFISDFAYKNDGLAAQRIRSLIEDLITSR